MARIELADEGGHAHRHSALLFHYTYCLHGLCAVRIVASLLCFLVALYALRRIYQARHAMQSFARGARTDRRRSRARTTAGAQAEAEDDSDEGTLGMTMGDFASTVRHRGSKWE